MRLCALLLHHDGPDGARDAARGEAVQAAERQNPGPGHEQLQSSRLWDQNRNMKHCVALFLTIFPAFPLGRDILFSRERY